MDLEPTVKKKYKKLLITVKDEKTCEEKHGAGAPRRKHLVKNYFLDFYFSFCGHKNENLLAEGPPQAQHPIYDKNKKSMLNATLLTKMEKKYGVGAP